MPEVTQSQYITLHFFQRVNSKIFLIKKSPAVCFSIYKKTILQKYIKVFKWISGDRKKIKNIAGQVCAMLISECKSILFV